MGALLVRYLTYTYLALGRFLECVKSKQTINNVNQSVAYSQYMCVRPSKSLCPESQ